MLSINITINAPAAEWTSTKLRLMMINIVSCIKEASINIPGNGNDPHVAWRSIRKGSRSKCVEGNKIVDNNWGSHEIRNVFGFHEIMNYVEMKFKFHNLCFLYHFFPIFIGIMWRKATSYWNIDYFNISSKINNSEEISQQATLKF